MNRLRFFLFTICLHLVVPARAGDVALTLMPPADPLAAGREAVVDLVALNPGAISARFLPETTLEGTLIWGTQSRAVTLRSYALAPELVPSGSFLAHRYALDLPADAAGRVMLEVAIPGALPLSTALNVEPDARVVKHPPLTPLARLGSSATIADTVINRTFAGRISPNDPIYFIYGGGDGASAKYQFSFDYRLASLDWGPENAPQHTTVQLGYTQRSLWDIDADSSPFYDTSYMPEVAFETLRRLPDGPVDGFTWGGWRTGFMHESNGREGLESRSLNILYFRPLFSLGSIASWHVVFLPEVFTYIRSLDENEDIDDYRGYGRLRFVIGKTDGPSLLVAAWAGKDFDHPTVQLDLAIPFHLRVLDVEAFVLVQYFNGYGESLRDYNLRSDALRMGIELLR